jgi:hypothetical protein
VSMTAIAVGFRSFTVSKPLLALVDGMTACRGACVRARVRMRVHVCACVCVCVCEQRMVLSGGAEAARHQQTQQQLMLDSTSNAPQAHLDAADARGNRLARHHGLCMP